MIEKMKFLSITGPKEDIDRVVGTYLSRYPIHLENALSELSGVQDLTPFVQANPYREWLAKAESYAAELGEPAEIPAAEHLPGAEEAVGIIRETEEKIRSLEEEQAAKRTELEQKNELLQQIAPFRMLPGNISRLLHFKYIKYRFGRIPKQYVQKFEQYAEESSDVIFIRCQTEANYVWGIYFAPRTAMDREEAILSSMHFEKVFLPDSYEGTAAEAYESLTAECRKLSHAQEDIGQEIASVVSGRARRILAAREKLQILNENFEVRKLAACTREHHNQTFYILCGWMSEEDVAEFQRATQGDEKVSLIVEEPSEELYADPPTRLKNPKIVKPFEMYIRMYGMPNYNEIDPTIFVSLTYAFLFGAMFGDLGQGLCLLVGGFLLYKWKKIPLAGIISTAGFFSSIFGILFGSVFGFEDLIPALWLRPKEAMMQVPVIGNLNTVFVVAIIFGMFLILSTMVMHIINAAKAHQRGDEFFDTNGVAGLVFYGTLTLVVILFVTGRALPAGILLAVLLGVPAVLLALKEPLTNLMEKKKPLVEDGVGMYAVQTFFEMFETMLSFFSNTLSFVRVGAFAVSHAAMMEVVLMLAGAENGGNINWIAVVLGNLFVCGMEGMIVGIQVLRLEYYEMFGRFYRGDGKEFRPFGKQEN